MAEGTTMGRWVMRGRRAALALAATAAACGAPAAAPPDGPAPLPAEGDAPAASPTTGRLPAIPRRDGPLKVDVVYPAEGQRVETDSTFVFGSVGTGAATLRINQQPVEVSPNGAFLAFVAIPASGLLSFEANAGGRQDAALRTVTRAGPPVGFAGPVRPWSVVAPRGFMTLQAGEMVPVRVRAPAGRQVRVVLPDGSSVPLVERAVAARPEGFMQEGIAARTETEYAGAFPARAYLRAVDRTVMAPTLGAWQDAPGAAYVEIEAEAGTAREPLPFSLAVLPAGTTRVATATPTREDSTVIGRALPGAGTPYHWTFPAGTRFTVTGEQDGMYRVRLTADQHVWVEARDVRVEAPGTPAPQASVGTVRLVPQGGWVDVRLSTSDRVPFRVEADGRAVTVSVYGAKTRTNWLQYGRQDPWIVAAAWDQPRDDMYALRVETADPVWGWTSFWDRDGTLVVRLRRPPRIDAAAPLRGRVVAVDAGHPPGGAIGPTRFTEAEANLAIAKRLVRMIEAAGGRVVETRPTTAAVELQPRVSTAMRADAEVLVVIHNNAFPDGVNPFESAGTTVFYNHGHSLPFAKLLQRELVRELGLRDLGVARADLALSRPTWMPSGYTETMFLMVPAQEAALRDPAVQERIAAAHFRALEAFLRERAAR